MSVEAATLLWDGVVFYVAGTIASPQQIVAHAAMLLAVGMVMAGALTRTMMPLRWLAAGSNVGLIIYGILHPSVPTLAIAAVLFPINLYRAIEVTRLTRRVHQSTVEADQAGLWLKPYMKTRTLKAGQTLFCKGDKAEHLYLLLDGHLELVEIQKPLETGRIFGEIALFSPGGVRTLTAQCVTPNTR